MKKKGYSRILAVIVSLMLLAVIAGGCGNVAKTEPSSSATGAASTEPAAESGATQAATEKAGPDISKKVTLNAFIMGERPRDMQLVNDELNKMTLKDLNCDVKFEFSTWTDFQTKYNLILTSGQDLDLIYTALWLDYPKYAKVGAYMALDDLLPEVTPDLYQSMSEDAWKSAKIKGKIYTVPADYDEYNTKGMTYREDLRKRYDLPEIKDLDTMRQYLEGIHKNDPKILPTATNYCMAFQDAIFPNYDFPTGPVGGGQSYAFLYMHPVGKFTELSSMMDDPGFIQEFKMIKEWADAGCWSRSVLSYKGQPSNDVSSGAAAAALDNQPAKHKGVVESVASSHPDWEIGYFSYADIGEAVHPNPASFNGMAVPKSSKNPERALLFMEKLHLDKEYYFITNYGIKGAHYDLNDKGEYKSLLASDKNGFNMGSMQPWGWNNTKLTLNVENGWNDGWVAINKHLGEKGTPGYDLLFSMDPTPVQSEIAALSQVMTQYFGPLSAGLVPDVDKAMATLKEKMNAAGYEKYAAEFKKQYLEFCSEYGLQ